MIITGPCSIILPDTILTCSTFTEIWEGELEKNNTHWFKTNKGTKKQNYAEKAICSASKLQRITSTIIKPEAQKNLASTLLISITRESFVVKPIFLYSFTTTDNWLNA